MTRARDLADLGGSANAGTITGDNIIINGDMAVAQRGTSATSLGNGNGGYHTVDRFRFEEGGAPTFAYTMSQSTEAPDGFGYSLKLECTTAQTSLAAADTLEIRTRLEGQDLQVFKKGTANHQKMALSFWVRSNKTGTYTLGLIDKDNSNRITSKSYTIDTADTWEYKSIIFDGEDTYAFTNDNGRSLDIGWYLGAGTNYTSGTLATTWQADDTADRAHSSQVNLSDTVGNNFYLTGVKLEVGTTATPFKHESYADNLAKCHRYYYKQSPDNASEFCAFGSGVMYNANLLLGSFSSPVNMRIVPSIGYSGTVSVIAGNAIGSVSALAITGDTDLPRFFRIEATSSSNLTVGHGAYVQLNQNAVLDLDAEL